MWRQQSGLRWREASGGRASFGVVRGSGQSGLRRGKLGGGQIPFGAARGSGQSWLRWREARGGQARVEQPTIAVRWQATTGLVPVEP